MKRNNPLLFAAFLKSLIADMTQKCNNLFLSSYLTCWCLNLVVFHFFPVNKLAFILSVFLSYSQFRASSMSYPSLNSINWAKTPKNASTVCLHAYAQLEESSIESFQIHRNPPSKWENKSQCYFWSQTEFSSWRYKDIWRYIWFHLSRTQMSAMTVRLGSWGHSNKSKNANVYFPRLRQTTVNYCSSHMTPHSSYIRMFFWNPPLVGRWVLLVHSI